MTNASARSRSSRTFLPALGLLAVAVLSGLVWWLIRHDDTGDPAAGGGLTRQSAEPSEDVAGTSPTTTQSPTQTPVQAGGFTFDPETQPRSDEDCAEVSYGDVAGWFDDNPCERVDRGLYTTDANGSRAAVSVVVVTMPEAQQAGELRGMVDTAGTGNVSDLLRDGTVELPDAPKVAGGAYASSQDGESVVIVEAAFYDGGDDAALDRITAAALEVSPR